MMRKPGGSKLVYDKSTRSIKKIRINRWKRLFWRINNNIENFLLWFFRRFLPFYFPNGYRQRRFLLAIWSAPMEPAALKDYWKSLRITLRGHNFRRAWVRLVLKKGTI